MTNTLAYHTCERNKNVLVYQIINWYENSYMQGASLTGTFISCINTYGQSYKMLLSVI